MTHDKWKKYRDELDKAGELDNTSGNINILLMKKGYTHTGEAETETGGLINHFISPKGQKMSVTLEVTP